MKKFFKTITLALANILALTPLRILAQEELPAKLINTDLLNQAATGAKYDTGIDTATAIPTTVGMVIGIILSFVGAIFFILIIFNGLSIMTAGGNEEKVSKSVKSLVNAVIGLLITVAAYFITWFISRFLGAA